MNTLRRHIVLAIAALLLTGGAQAQAPAAKPLAVLFAADWCYNCKVIKPKLAAAQKGLEDRIDFVVLDFTTDDGKKAAKARAKQLNIAPIYFANRATGWVSLINPAREQVGELRQSMTVEEMRAALEKLAAG